MGHWNLLDTSTAPCSVRWSVQVNKVKHDKAKYQTSYYRFYHTCGHGLTHICTYKYIYNTQTQSNTAHKNIIIKEYGQKCVQSFTLLENFIFNLLSWLSKRRGYQCWFHMYFIFLMIDLHWKFPSNISGTVISLKIFVWMFD